jgi:hypothetical protein
MELMPLAIDFNAMSLFEIIVLENYQNYYTAYNRKIIEHCSACECYHVT